MFTDVGFCIAMGFCIFMVAGFCINMKGFIPETGAIAGGESGCDDIISGGSGVEILLAVGGGLTAGFVTSG